VETPINIGGERVLAEEQVSYVCREAAPINSGRTAGNLETRFTLCALRA